MGRCEQQTNNGTAMHHMIMHIVILLHRTPGLHIHMKNSKMNKDD